MARGKTEGKVRAGSWNTNKVKVGGPKGIGEVLISAVGLSGTHPVVVLGIDSLGLEARVAMPPQQARELARELVAAADAAEPVATANPEVP